MLLNITFFVNSLFGSILGSFWKDFDVIGSIFAPFENSRGVQYSPFRSLQIALFRILGLTGAQEGFQGQFW